MTARLQTCAAPEGRTRARTSRGGAVPPFRAPSRRFFHPLPPTSTREPGRDVNRLVAMPLGQRAAATPIGMMRPNQPSPAPIPESGGGSGAVATPRKAPREGAVAGPTHGGSMSKWRTDLENAPEGVSVLVFCPDAAEPKIFVAEKLTFEGDPDGPQWWDRWNERAPALSDVCPPIHWQPLPKPPSATRPASGRQSGEG